MNFEMKDMGESSYVIGIEILCDGSQELLGLSQKGYIKRVLKRFSMNNCSAKSSYSKRKTNLISWNAKYDVEQKEMETIPYSSIVRSLMYV